MLRTLIMLMKESSSISEANRLIQEFTPQIEKALRSVDDMVDDVMAIGRKLTLHSAPTNPESLIESTLTSLFHIHRNAKIKIEYGFAHKHQINVDSVKVLRVFSNIVNNAIQAMSGEGKLWFRTKEQVRFGRRCVEFCIGNTGSYVPKEDISRLFEPFFTKGKTKGTGLGLAIAKRIVNTHGGEISCRSQKGRGTEFFLTLPIAEGRQRMPHAKLPMNSQEIIATYVELSDDKEVEKEQELEGKLIKRFKEHPEKLRVLIVDDETGLQPYAC